MIVLIVEDEPLIALAMQMLVEDEGWSVLGPFATPAAARSALASGASFDVALLDCWLGNQSCWDIAETLEARSIPFAFASGRGKEEIDPRFAKRPVFEKPVDEEQVRRFLRSVAAKR